MPNKLHQIRIKESTLNSVPSKSLEEPRKKHLARKQVSSAYQRKRDLVNPAGADDVPVDDSDAIYSSFLTDSTSVQPESQLHSQKFSTLASVEEVAKQRRMELMNASMPNSRDGVRTHKTYFVPSLKELCARSIALNFHKNSIDLEKDIKNASLRKVIVDQLSVRLPLQISVEKIHDESYWKRACEMRWTDGQIGSFLRSDISKMPSSHDDAQTAHQSIPSTLSSSTRKNLSIADLLPDPKATSWKQLYLEQNLQEFLESIQSEESIAQELHVLSVQPEKDPTGHVSSEMLHDFQSQAEKMRESLVERERKLKEQAEKKKKRKKKNHEVSNSDVKAEEPSRPNKKSFASFSNEIMSQNSSGYLDELPDDESELPSSDPSMFELHSNRMKPNLNYYLLHTDPDILPTKKFREKLKDLFDGSEGMTTSRLSNLSNDDDIFTFYDNAIYRSYYKTYNHKSQYAFKDIQYWLLAKKEGMDQNDHDIKNMLRFVKQENFNRLKKLCTLSNEYVKKLEIKAFRSRIDLSTILDLLPNLEHLQLSYRVLNAGMSFQLDMAGMKQADAKHLTSALSDPTICPRLLSLNLSENMITDNLLKGILTGLLKNESLRHIDLSHNKITHEGVTVLSAYLKKNNKLQSLNLCDNSIKHNSESEYIAEALNSNTSLKYLDLRLNRLGDEGGQAIIEALNQNHIITYLNISHNELGAKTLKALCQTLKSEKCSITHLDISGNPLPDEAGEELMDVLNINKSILVLECRKSGLQTSDLNKITALLQKRHITLH